jgi:hypothetical protein
MRPFPTIAISPFPPCSFTDIVRSDNDIMGRIVLAFDLYGTLFDTSSIQDAVLMQIHSTSDTDDAKRKELAGKITTTWRTLQLE